MIRGTYKNSKVVTIIKIIIRHINTRNVPIKINILHSVDLNHESTLDSEDPYNQ